MMHQMDVAPPPQYVGCGNSHRFGIGVVRRIWRIVESVKRIASDLALKVGGSVKQIVDGEEKQTAFL